MTKGSLSGLPRENIELPDGSVLRRRSLVSDDAFIDAVAADVGHLGEWLRWARHPPTREETERFRAEQDADWDAGRSFVYVLTPPDRHDRVLGGGAMFPNGEVGVLEIGYWVCSPATGRGLATRAAAALTEEAWGSPASRPWRSTATGPMPEAPRYRPGSGTGCSASKRTSRRPPRRPDGAWSGATTVPDPGVGVLGQTGGGPVHGPMRPSPRDWPRSRPCRQA